MSTGFFAEAHKLAERAFRQMVSGRQCSGPITAQAMEALVGSSSLKIASFRAGMRPLVTTKPLGKKLLCAIESLRRGAMRRNLTQAAKGNPWRTAEVRRSEKLISCFLAKIRALFAEHPKPELRALEHTAHFYQRYLNSRLPNVAFFSLARIEGALLERASLALLSIEGETAGTCQKLGRNRADHFLETLHVKTKLADEFQAWSVDRKRGPGTFEQMEARLLKRESPPSSGDCAALPLAVLADQLTALYFSRQGALCRTFKEIANTLADDPTPQAYQASMVAVEKLLLISEAAGELCRNPYTTTGNEFQAILRDFLWIARSPFIERCKLFSAVADFAKATARFLELEHRVQLWQTPIAGYWSNEAVQQFERDSLSRKFSIPFFGKRADYDAGTWITYSYSNHQETHFARHLEGLSERYDLSLDDHKRRKICDLVTIDFYRFVSYLAGDTLTELRHSIEAYTPQGAPLEGMSFRKSLATPLPDTLLDQVMALQSENMIDPSQPGAQLGLKTIIPRAELESRIHVHDATVITVIKGEELLAAYFLCSMQKELPPLGIKLREELTAYFEREGKGEEIALADAPVVLCDLLVSKKGSGFKGRHHEQLPVGIAVQKLQTATLSQFFTSPLVYCVAICRVGNLALEALKRQGWCVAEGHLYQEPQADGSLLAHNVIYMPVRSPVFE